MDFSTFLLKYNYIVKDENKNYIFTIDEHKKIIYKNNFVFWWIFNSSKTFNNTHFETIKDSNIDYFLILSKNTDWVNTLHLCHYEWIYKKDDIINNENLKEKIPEYYRDRKNINYYIKIIKFEQVSLAGLDIFIPTSKQKENKVNIRSYFSWQLTFSILNTNKSIIPNNIEINKSTDFLLYIKWFSKIKKIIWIKFINYYWFNENIWYLDLSNWEYKYQNLELIKNKDFNAKNIFSDYWINNLNCIVWKNWVWKSRIINALCNFFNDWQNFNIKLNRDIKNEEFEIYFEDSDLNIIKVNNNSYIWEVIWSNTKKIIDFSSIKNFYISNSANDSIKLENNNILYWGKNESIIFSSYQYFWVLSWKTYDINNMKANFNILMIEIINNYISNQIYSKWIESIWFNLWKIDFLHCKSNIKIFEINENKTEINFNNLYELLKYIKWIEIKKDDKIYKKEVKLEIEWIEIINLKVLLWLIKSTKKSNKNTALSTDENLNISYINIEQYKNIFQSYDLWKFSVKKLINNSYKDHPNNFLKDIQINLFYDFLKYIFSIELINIDFEFWSWLKFSDLSSWEQTIINHIAKLTFWIVKNSGRDINFFFDEPDITLHPEWQRKFINVITEILWLVNSNKTNINEENNPIKRIRFNNNWKCNTSIFISTHSPIMLSDIPKENILALEKNEEWEIKKINDQKLWKTFLNNLYELYWNPFFTNSFIWEFAIKKYREASWIIDLSELEEVRSILINKIKNIKSKELIEISKKLRSIHIANYKENKLFNDLLNIINKKSNIWDIENIIWDEVILNQLEKDIKNKEEINLWIILDLFHEIIDNLLLEELKKWKE